MEETRPTVQEAYLRQAQTMGRDYYQKVKIGGKNYFVMVLQGGDLSRMQAHDTEKLRNLSETFFSAHQDASETDLNDSDITHIDSEGIHFRERETQISRETGIGEEAEDLLMAEFDSEKDAIVEHYNQARPAPVAKEAIPAQYRPYLDEEHEDEDGLYDEAAVKHAINHYTLARFTRVKDLVVSANPGAQESMERQLSVISSAPISFEEVIDQSCDVLRQHMTAQTVWKAMMNVLLPEQLIFVAAPEEEEEIRDLEEEEEVLPSGSSNAFGHLDSLDPVPLRSGEALLGEHRDRENEELDPFASVTPPPTSGNWLSRFGSYAYSYVPSRTSIPLVGRLFSASTPVSRVEENVELRPMGSPRVVDLGSGYSSGEEEYSDYSDYSSEEEEDWIDLDTLDSGLHEPLALHSVHEREEIRIETVTAQQVHNELTLAAQGAPEGNVPVASKQAVARTALDKIRAKMRKEEDIQAFTADEQRIIKEAITRNAQWLSLPGRSHNSQLTTILGGLETIYQGH
ncbi:MAG: hypothetical protein KFB95_06175 [Simkaniaceae bacterium]|nr:MAG: hypothetical protein KFB95_06175 [Simkaniaceae bacterium]